MSKISYHLGLNSQHVRKQNIGLNCTAYAPVRDSGFRFQDSLQDSGFISRFLVFPDLIAGYHLFKTYQWYSLEVQTRNLYQKCIVADSFRRSNYNFQFQVNHYLVKTLFSWCHADSIY